MASSIVAGHILTGCIDYKLYLRSQVALSWNPLSKLSISKSEHKNIGLWSNLSRLSYDGKTKRNSLAVNANSVPDVPLPPGQPPSGSMRSWIVGMVISLILTIFTHKWGPLWVLKNRIDNAVQTVEDIVEAVEKVAGEVDKIAEDLSDDLPEGKLKNLVKSVENIAEKTAKTADSLDNIIDKVQEAEEQVQGIVESIAKERKNSPKEAK